MSQALMMEASWLDRLAPEFEKPYMKKLEAFLQSEYQARQTIYPPSELIFNAFCHTPFEKVKVLIIGQDPYHGPQQAHGLCFSVPKGIAPPPSLQNIFKELSDDVKIKVPSHGNLESWAKQGVMLLNATLTVRENEPKSHYGKGWETFTDKVVELLVAKKRPIAFVLWGKSAFEKWRLLSINPEKTAHHLVLTAAHPSPLSAYAGFFGCKHFSQINSFLTRTQQKPVDWEIL